MDTQLRRQLDQLSATTAPEQMKQVLHDLQVHQLELEMQNEELRRAQVELDLARARYFDLYDLAPIGYCTLDERGLIIQVNLTAVTMLGVVRNAAIGSAFSRYVHGGDHPILHALLRRLVDTRGEHQTAEVRVVRHDRTVFWAHLVVTSARNEAGDPEHRVVLSDVSARKEAEDARREGEARYRELFTRASQGIVLWSAEGGVVEVNPAFCRMHGWTVKELSKMTLLALDRSGAATSPERIGRMAAGEVLTFDVQHRHRDGHTLMLEASTSLIYVAGTARVLGFYRDLTKALAVPPASASAATSRGRILVIDDEPTVRDVIRRVLGIEHEVLAVASAVEAKTLLEIDVQFDVILCAVLMPEMTGMELFAWLEQRAPALATRLVFVSGVTLAPSGALKEGQAELRKPFQPVELKNLVAQLVETRRAQAPDPAEWRETAH